MANRWTPEQLEAITQRDCNLLVAAAAGAGKTAVLVERIIRKITDGDKPVDIDRLLVVTFTNAAATEMRERIGNALSDALEADPGSVNLQKQMALLDRASIMTLHSFCLEVVKSHFHSLDLDPLFRIADETENTLMKLDILDELFEDKYENELPDSVFFRLVESYGGGRDDSALREMVLGLHRFTRSHPWPEQWLAAQAEAYNIGASACLSSTPWARVLLKGAAAELQGLTALLEKAAAPASRAQGLEPYCGVLEEDTAKLGELLCLCSAEVPDWDALHSAFLSYEQARLPRCGKDADKSAQEAVKAARSRMKEKTKKLLESGFDATAAEITEELQKLYPLLKYLSDMVSEFESLYSKKKREKGLLDFNDLEHFALKVLIEDGLPTAAAKELRERYEEILVDEYQDSNLIQELILETVSGNQDGRYNIFMVGDVKQSIYRFRQAKPELFMSKYTTYPHERGHDSRVIQLYKNFRSRSDVINGVNFIFRQIMSQTVGELDYTKAEYLNPGAEFEPAEDSCNAGGAIEVHILDVTSAEDEIDPGCDKNGTAPGGSADGGISASAADTEAAHGRDSARNSEYANAGADTDDGGADGTDDEEESLDSIQSEARIVGRRIRELVSSSPGGFGVFDKKLGKYRPAEYRDIVILMRATRNWADVFTGELAAMGIPAYADTGLGYFKTVEVDTMLSLLQIIDNPLQDIPLLAVLRSPIAGFTTDELADIRLADKSADFYEAMKLYASEVKESRKAEERLYDIQPAAGEHPGNAQSSEAPSGETYTGEAQPNTMQPAGTRQKAATFLQKLQAWRNSAQFLPTDELVWQLLTETGYYSYVAILPGGPERQANLRMLFERARQYEETSFRGLFNFINFISKLRSGGGDMGSAKILGENDNVVRIMSIHKSKGLEFPVVILAGCGKRFNMMDLNAGILLHQELGYGPDLVDLERRTITPVMPKYAIRQRLRLETLSEEMRILYVAFTRAKEKLIITGSVRNVARSCARWCAAADTNDDRLPFYEVMQASNYLDWIGPALVRHESAASLRMEAGSCVRLFNNESSCWDVRLWGTGAAKVKKEALAAEDNIRRWLEGADGTKCADQDKNASDEVKSQLIAMLEWDYPYRKLSSVPAKVSVTELKRRFMENDGEASATPYIAPLVPGPLFMETEKGLSAARKGTILHFVMQHLDIRKLKEACWRSGTGDNTAALVTEIGLQLERMKAGEMLTEAEAQSVHPGAVASFFTNDVGVRMLNADIVRRETAFTIEIKCSEVYNELQELYGNETMLLQGVIDCWFETENGLLLLDYKTDYVPSGGAEIIKERYKVQIDYYTRALERMTCKRVAEKYLYLFHSGELISC